MKSGVPALLSKIARFRPHVVCFVGKGISETFRKEVARLVDSPSPSTEVTSTPESSSSSSPISETEVGTAKSRTKGTKPKGNKRKRTVTKKLIFSLGVQPVKTVHAAKGLVLPPIAFDELLIFLFR